MSSSKSRTYLSVFLLVLLIGFPQLSETIYSPALPAMVKDLETTPYWVEFTLSIYFLGFALGTASWGYLCDLWGRRPSMLAGLIVYGVSCYFLSQAQSITQVLVFRYLQAFGASVGSIVTQTMIRDSLRGKERARVFSIITMALAFTPAIGPVLGGYICTVYHWRVSFFLLLAIACVLCFYCFLRLPETRPEAVKITDQSSFIVLTMKLLRDRKIWGHILLITSCNGILFGFFAEGPFLAVELLGMTPQQYGLFGLVICASSLLSSAFSYRMHQIKTPVELISLGSVVMLSGACFLLLLAAFGVIQTRSFASIALTGTALFTSFLGFGLIIPNSISIALQPYQDVVGTAGAIFGLFYYCGIASMTALVGAMHNGTVWTLPLFFLVQSCVLVIGTRLIKHPLNEALV